METDTKPGRIHSTDDFPPGTLFIEIRGWYDGWSVAQLADGSLVNRWPHDHRLHHRVNKWIEGYRDAAKQQPAS